MSTRISVDWENNAEEWWSRAVEEEDAGRAPHSLRPLLARGYDYIVTTPAEARRVLRWASTLPGWDDGADYARNPLTFQEGDIEYTTGSYGEGIYVRRRNDVGVTLTPCLLCGATIMFAGDNSAFAAHDKWHEEEQN